MAVAGVAIASIVIPSFVFLPHVSWPFGIIGCKYLVMPFMELFAGVCVLTHTALSFARYAVLACKSEFSNSWFLRGIIAGIWIVSFLVLVAPLMGFLGEFDVKTSPSGSLECQFLYKSELRLRAYRVGVFFVTYVIPMVTTGYSYFRINRIVMKNMHRVESSLSNDTALSRRRKSRRLNRMLTVMYMMFGMTTLPSHLLLFLFSFNLGSIRTFSGGKLLFTAAMLMFYLQIIVHPAVVLYMGDEYRKGLAEINDNVRKISEYSVRKLSAYNCAFNQKMKVEWQRLSMEKLNKRRRGNVSTTSYTIVTEISHFGDSTVDIRNSVVSKRKRSSSASGRKCSRKSSGGTRREPRISSSGRSPYRKKISADSLNRLQHAKKWSSTSIDSLPYGHHKSSTSSKTSYKKMNSKTSLEDEVFTTSRRDNIEHRLSQMRIDSCSSLEEDGYEKSFRRKSYRKMNSYNSLDEDGYLSSSPHLQIDSSSSLDEGCTDNQLPNSRMRKAGVVTFQRCLSDVQEDLHSDSRRSDVDCLAHISECTVMDNTESLRGDEEHELSISDKEGRKSKSKTISFYADGLRVLIPVSKLENIFCYQFDDADDTYLHLPDQSEEEDEDEEEYNKETIM